MITAFNQKTFKVYARTNKFEVVSDVESSKGGQDEGPSPHELVEAALASCTIMTLQMYADRKKWDLQSVNVKITITKEGAESQFLREISLQGNLSQDEQTRLLDIANKCPIHKLLESKVSIESKLVTSATQPTAGQ